MTPTLTWDPRLDARGAQLTRYPAQPGNTYYTLVRGEWRDEQQSQGKHHIFVDVIDEQGKRLVGVPVRYSNGGEAVIMTEAKPGEEASSNFAMFASGWGYRVEVGYASDTVSRLGMGSVSDPRAGVHTSYFFQFQRTTQGTVDLPPTLPDPGTPGVTPPGTPDPILEALAVARHILDTARQAIDTATELYSRRTGG